MSTPPKSQYKPKRWADMTPQERILLVQEIEAGGFGAELQVRRIFQASGFDAQAFYFSDRDAEKSREVDIHAYRTLPGMITTGGRVWHAIIGEVKKDYTWILGDQNGECDDDHVVAKHTPKWYSNGIATHFCDPEWNELSEIICGEHLKAPGISTSIFQHKGASKEDAWYEAATKVFKACAAVKAAQLYASDVLRLVAALRLRYTGTAWSPSDSRRKTLAASRC